MVKLRLLFDRGVRYPVGTGKEAVQMIKAAVLGIDHYDRLDLGETLHLCVRGTGIRYTEGYPYNSGELYPHQQKFLSLPNITRDRVMHSEHLYAALFELPERPLPEYTR